MTVHNVRGLDPEKKWSIFVEEMNKWEIECASRFEENNLGSKDEYALRLESMNNIFMKYCTENSMIDGRTGEFRIPPEYDLESEHIIQVIRESDREVIVYTEQTAGFKVKNRYKMLLIDGEWLIDEKEWKPLGRPWEKAYL